MSRKLTRMSEFLEGCTSNCRRLNSSQVKKLTLQDIMTYTDFFRVSGDDASNDRD